MISALLLADIIMSIMKVFVGAVLCLGLWFVILFIGGFTIETQGTLRCRRLHPKYKTRCALKSFGHVGVQHVDRRGRRWW